MQSIGYANLAHLDPQYGLCKLATSIFSLHSVLMLIMNIIS